MSTQCRYDWDFISPWCIALKKHIDFGTLEYNDDTWDMEKFRLQVSLPRRAFFDSDLEFQHTFQLVRDALKLIAAAGHVEKNAFRYLLTKFCGVSFGKIGEPQFEQEIPIKYLLLLDLQPDFRGDFDIVQLCGVKQRQISSESYLKAMEKIGSRNRNLMPDNSGMDIEIPVQVYFTLDDEMIYPFESHEVVEQLGWIKNWWEKINREWSDFHSSNDKRVVEAGMIRCTFVLEPMVGDFTEFLVTKEFTEIMEQLTGAGIRFSRIQALDLDLATEVKNDARTTKITLGELFHSLFGTSQPASPQRHESVSLYCDSNYRDQDFDALCSAIAVNRTIENLHLRLNMERGSRINAPHWWKWLAYGLFSKRAQRFSTLKTLKLTGLHTMSAADMAAFKAVIEADNPERMLVTCQREQLHETSATLKVGAKIRWQFDSQGKSRAGSKPLVLTFPIPFVRVLIDKPTKKWVDALIPGFGWCQVHRDDLIFETRSPSTTTRSLISLTIEFYNFGKIVSDGLPQFLHMVGPSIRSLTLQGPRIKLSLSNILRSCQHLEELTLSSSSVDVQLDIVKLGSSFEPVGFTSFENVQELGKTLHDASNPIVKGVRRLRVRLQTEEDAVGLLQMLDYNQFLEYVDVIAPTRLHPHYSDDFRKYHLKPICVPRKLPVDVKIAFISALLYHKELAKRQRTMKCGLSRCGSAIYSLDQSVLSTIFEFAALPVLRQVYYTVKGVCWLL